jgi:hypothetical protein
MVIAIHSLFYAFSVYMAIHRNATPMYNESPVLNMMHVMNVCVEVLSILLHAFHLPDHTVDLVKFVVVG